MKLVVKEGDYTKLGAVRNGETVVFTFQGELEDVCRIVLVHKQSRVETKVTVPGEFCLGSLRSVSISGFSPDEYLYYYEINDQKVVDPYACAIDGRQKWNDLSRSKNHYEIFGAFEQEGFDWEDDPALEIPKQNMVIYKLHVRGFSMNRGAAKSIAGTFEAVRRKIAYFKALGITTIEFMPVYEFEEMAIPKPQPIPKYIKWEEKDGDLIRPAAVMEEPSARLNYWGYGDGNYFAVKASYASNPENAANEFRRLIKELHANGIECVMELHFLENADHNLIRDALRYWVCCFHIDGFHLLGFHLPITAIVQDLMLSRTKLFYTDFDNHLRNMKKTYHNLYIYKEEYLYPARKILNHMNGNLADFLNQQRKQNTSVGYVNFVSSNNGFTMADLFMYNNRHNEDNGENNEDGNVWNFSNNYGIEGPSRKKFIVSIRRRQWRNAMMMVFLAQGVPLIWSGDEIMNSQSGNNNAYCQDNAVGWLNWQNLKSHAKELDFVQKLSAFRRNHPLITREEPYHFSDYRHLGCPDVSYHGEKAWITGLDSSRMSIGILYNGAYLDDNAEDIYVAYNFYSGVTTLALPKPGKSRKWYLAANTALEENQFLDEPLLCKNQQTVTIEPESICIIIGK